MMNRRHLLATGAMGALLPAWANAQSFPSKPIRIVVPFGAGGIADLTARAVANKLGEGLHQAVIIDNKPGAGGVVAGEAVAKSEPDGHTLLLMSNGTAVSAGLFKSLSFDAQKDFAPIITLGFFDIAVLAAANSRFKSMQEMLAYAKANPGKLNIATINIGSTQHLAAELLKTSAGVDFQVVPFNGSPAVLTALRGGQVDAAVEILGPMMSQISSKAVRPLAVMGAKRTSLLAEVPTVAESGVRGFEVASWNALAAPARTPPAVIAQLNREANKALGNPELRKQLADLSVSPAGGTPEQLRDLLASEVRRWSDVITRANVPRL
ncbi:tripartite-type tricarboxylate transporter receptor subunit TctC [Rhodoferax ferrireducens]|uniref:Tripartite-type tricarboxylate transporter receptor subunit TctC n=1 Tax=Rhodoferax ferrireducens TaxID=192843 RepID=A0ABU2C9E1_9BURK|nr:tripartite tricarboxylate transporter substrate binding protein [Rhodoferax ferrireducens]MDR7377928.1 tripartite-type tricarboxylate transporter receptor subunit TctC [Rhodoferax ferrireducens]